MSTVLLRHLKPKEKKYKQNKHTTISLNCDGIITNDDNDLTKRSNTAEVSIPSPNSLTSIPPLFNPWFNHQQTGIEKKLLEYSVYTNTTAD